MNEYMMSDEQIKMINDMLKEKENKMIEFLNEYMSPQELQSIGEDIIRHMPNPGDIAHSDVINE